MMQNERRQEGNKTKARSEETGMKETVVKQDTSNNTSITKKSYRLKDVVDKAVEDGHDGRQPSPCLRYRHRGPLVANGRLGGLLRGLRALSRLRKSLEGGPAT
jgi:hypothetical protein